MNEVFKTALSLSCSGALLVLLLCLLRPLLRTRFSRQWQYYIWLAAAARLLLPFAPETNLMDTLFQRIGNDVLRWEAQMPSGQDSDSASLRQGDPESERQNGRKEQLFAGDEEGNYPKELPGAVIWKNLWLLWLVTALILFIRKITIYQSFVRYIRAGSREVEELDLLERFGRLAEESHVKTAVELSTNSLIASPLLIGFFRPRIVLPTVELSASDFQYTVLHELTHYKRRDMFYKWLVQFTVCLHWFNPLVYLMSREAERDCELSCDEAVIRKLDSRERRAYGDTLLNAMGSGGSYRNAIASVTLGESKERLKERLDAIAGFRKKPKYIAVLAAVTTAAVCCAGAAAGAYAAGSAYAPGEAFTEKPETVGALTLAEKEYTLEELERLALSGIVINTLSDDVSVVRGGDTLKIEYYALDAEEYTFHKIENRLEQTQSIWMYRSQPSETGDGRSITVTVPEQLQLEACEIRTTSGDISLTDCTAGSVQANTQNGKIDIWRGSASVRLSVSTETGDALVSETVLPDSGSDASSAAAFFQTGSGTITFQPRDSADHYCFFIDYGEESEVYINGEGVQQIQLLDSFPAEASESGLSGQNGTASGNGLEYGVEEATGNRIEYDGGEAAAYLKKRVFTINESAPVKIKFQSQRGTLIVQDK